MTTLHPLESHGITRGTSTQYSATPGAQVLGGMKHQQGVPRPVPGVTGQTPYCVTHTFDGAANGVDEAELPAGATVASPSVINIVTPTKRFMTCVPPPRRFDAPDEVS
jgi:hypothetical protein